MSRLTKALKFVFAGCAAALLAGCASTQQSNVSVDFYSISGNSTAALDKEIKRKGPRVNGGRHAVAVARIRMIPNVEFDQRARTCHVSSAKVAVDAKVTLPHWTGRQSASEKLGKAWDNIDRYTRLHEAMHVAIAFRYAKRMENGLLKLDPKENCSLMRKQASALVDRYLDEHDATQKEFDADEQRRFSMLASRRRASAENG